MKVVRPGGFELPTFWFVGGKSTRQQTTAANNTQRNQRKARLVFGSRRMVSYPVHGQLHGQFRTIISSEEKQPKEAAQSALTVSDPLPTLWRESSGAPASGQVKARAPFTFLIIKEPNYAKIYSRARQPLALLPHNQVEHRAHDCDFAHGENTKSYFVVTSTSASTPDVPPQITDCVDVARTVRECVRVWESGEHAN